MDYEEEEFESHDPKNGDSTINDEYQSFTTRPPTKPASGYYLFIKEKRGEVSRQLLLKMKKKPTPKEVVKQIASMWNKLTKEQKEPYNRISKENTEKWKEEMVEWERNGQPKHVQKVKNEKFDIWKDASSNGNSGDEEDEESDDDDCCGKNMFVKKENYEATDASCQERRLRALNLKNRKNRESQTESTSLKKLHHENMMLTSFVQFTHSVIDKVADDMMFSSEMSDEVTPRALFGRIEEMWSKLNETEKSKYLFKTQSKGTSRESETIPNVEENESNEISFDRNKESISKATELNPAPSSGIMDDSLFLSISSPPFSSSSSSSSSSPPFHNTLSFDSPPSANSSELQTGKEKTDTPTNQSLHSRHSPSVRRPPTVAQLKKKIIQLLSEDDTEETLSMKAFRFRLEAEFGVSLLDQRASIEEIVREITTPDSSGQ
ncbi:uncharacterized protein MONOS_877 [Monocercomonoides exilis]|uniref:uncharacterized protein n=1 Tax=Monocercomonoides exilis TaxID=2049356 RepID=UPI0035595ECC|nr:hypothetical protein MONOS_877 [Monocercomonoides exilis]|eukprot:MONOS_877.1-p1 / transcript=MONOS_877.1 / gene=MONOS_877 / organism=Monocercomonoides_exilis_PA203 / gene_product=unspecified product / transcript_product=unspecified product / location=Mono_scaffold00014:188191-190053(-) / protein_length=434 / sequence_SO=supercontig / SO=protein_coding / is_pseudo=false